MLVAAESESLVAKIRLQSRMCLALKSKSIIFSIRIEFLSTSDSTLPVCIHV